MDRRDFVLMSTFLVFGSEAPFSFAAQVQPSIKPPKGKTMYGIIGRIIAEEGARDDLASVMLKGIAGMPGCLSYVVAHDVEDPNALWITEVWDEQASHQASLSLPSVQEAIAKGRPMIAGFGERFITAPLGGQGLPQP